MDDLTSVTRSWPTTTSVLAIADDTSILGAGGDLDWQTRIASITKLFTAYACLIAIEEGTIALSEEAGPPGSTVQHLLAHASGLAFESGSSPVARVGERRIYSNSGIEALAVHLETKAGMDFGDYLREAVISPLGLANTELVDSPAYGIRSTVRDLISFGQELLTPTLLDSSTLDMATSVIYPELKGMLPGFGSMNPNPWGLGFELRGEKFPLWMAENHPPSAFGHFGGSGSFLWIDPVHRLIGASLSDRRFGEWAARLWPEANTELLARYTSGNRSTP